MCSTESVLQKVLWFSVWWFLITAAGRGPRPTVNVDVIKVLFVSEYLFLMIREKKQCGHKIQIAMTRSLFC